MSNYYTLQEARNDGITEAQKSDNALEVLIDYWEDIIEKLTGRKFYQREEIVIVDSKGIPMIDMPSRLAPCQEVEYVKVDKIEISPERYHLERDVPAIVFIAPSTRNIFLGSGYHYPTGRKNVEIKGTFGYEAENLPGALKLLMKELVMRDINGDLDFSLKNEKIGNYSYTTADVKEGIFNDNQLNMYLRNLCISVGVSLA